MTKKPKKTELVSFLCNSMTEEQWDLIARLRNIPTPPTKAKRESFLNSLFKKKISVSSAKGKGRDLQQWACRKISGLTGLPWGKDEEIASREGGQNGADVRLSAAARKMFPFTVECKSGDRWNVVYAIKQCQANLYPGTEWLVVLDRPSPRPEKRILPIIMMDGEVFFRMLENIPRREGERK